MSDADEILSLRQQLREARRAAYREGYDNALAEQPFDRAAIIEECARITDKFAELHKDVPAFRYLAAAIRALKDRKA